MEQWVWNTWLHVLCRDYENTPKLTNPQRLDLLHTGSDKEQVQYCLNSDGFIHYMRAFQGHSGGNKVDPLLLENVQIPNRWSVFFITSVPLSRYAFYHPVRIDYRKEDK